MSGPKTAIELAESIQEGCINWSDRFFDHDEAVTLIGTYVAARLSEAAERAEAWRDRWWGVRIPQRAGAESMQSLRSAIMGNSTGAPRPEPCQTDDLLWQEIFSLREKVKIAVAAVKSSDPTFDDAEFTHRLNSVDYDQLMEELSGDKPEPRQTAGEGEAVNETLTYLNAELDKRDGENGKMLALIRSLVTVFATEPGIDLLWDDARALLARKGE